MLRFVLILVLALGAPASAQDDPLRAQLAGWGCEPLQLLMLDDRVYAACGSAGVFVVERGALVERRRVPGSARAVYARDGQAWVESSHVEARPLADLALEGVPAAVGPAAPDGASPAGAPPGAAPSHPAARSPAAALEGVAPSRAESKLWPSRRGGYVAFELGARPLLPLDTRGLAVIGEVALSYVGQRHWFAQLRGFPLGGMITEGKDTPLMGALVQGGYDHPYFAIGLGVGALTRGHFDEYDEQSGYALNRREQSTRFALSQYARLGAIDGLHLSLHNVFVLLDEWKFGFIELRAQIPLTRGTWLVPAGAGGAQAGFFYSEVGLRLLLRGDRGTRSLFVRPAAGVAGVDQRDRYDSMRLGPMVGIHLEYRK